MLTIRSGALRAVVAAAALSVCGRAWAGASAAHVAERAAAAKTTQDRVSALQDRLAAVQPQNAKVEAFARAARVQLALAQKSLDRNDTRVAHTLADVAERLTALAEGREPAR